MIISGHLLLPDSTTGAALPDSAAVRPGWVRLEGARIAEVHVGAFHPRPDLGNERTLVSPGFADTHLHVPQFECLGQYGRTLLDWLDTVVFPTEARWADADHAGAAAAQAARQLLRVGTTRVAAYATVHFAGAQAAIEAFAATGLKGHIGQVLMDRGAPAELCRPADQLLRECAQLRSVGGIQPSVNPRFAISCTMELMHGAATLARATGRLVQTHYAEMEAECRAVRELFNGLSYTEVYERAGLLTPRTILAHAVHVNASDRAALHRRGTIVAHCPTANSFLRSGRMDWPALASDGVGVGLGSDVAGGPERSMVRVARAALENLAAVGAEPRPGEARRLWAQIAWRNAAMLERGARTALEAGASPELLVVEPDVRWSDLPDPLGTLLWAWDDRWLRAVVIDGVPRAT